MRLLRQFLNSLLFSYEKILHAQKSTKKYKKSTKKRRNAKKRKKIKNALKKHLKGEKSLIH